MAFQPSADSFGIRRLGFKCSRWHLRQANEAVASEPSIFSENHDYKRFFRVAVTTYIPIFRGLDARGGRLRTDTDTYTHKHRRTRTHMHTRTRTLSNVSNISYEKPYKGHIHNKIDNDRKE